MHTGASRGTQGAPLSFRGQRWGVRHIAGALAAGLPLVDYSSSSSDDSLSVGLSPCRSGGSIAGGVHARVNTSATPCPFSSLCDEAIQQIRDAQPAAARAPLTRPSAGPPSQSAWS